MHELPDLDDLLDHLQVLSIPMRIRFRGVDHREIALIPGPFGYGEFSPFIEYQPSEAARWLAAAIETAWWGWPIPLRTSIPVNATVPAVPADQVAAILDRYHGCRTAKVKVAEKGQSLNDDVNRVAAVRDYLGQDARVRVDANMGWSVDQAQVALARLARYDLEYAEQPCPDVEDLRDLRIALARNGTDVLVAADESIRRAEDPFRVAALEAADVAVVKVQPLGGVHAALGIAERIGLPIVVSSAIDSSVGISAGLALASALPELPFACGLATLELMDGDVTPDRLVPEDGQIELRRPMVDPQLLDRWQAPADRVVWWRERVAACYRELTSFAGSA